MGMMANPKKITVKLKMEEFPATVLDTESFRDCLIGESFVINDSGFYVKKIYLEVK